jgi:D-alanyl-D-alanine carboxypeptidase
MKDRLLWTRVDAGGAVAGEGGDAIVPWWSLTKPAIAAAALRLAAAGRLDLNAPTEAGVGLRAVLRHAAGLPDYGALPAYGAAVAAGGDPWPADELLARAAALSAPGGWCYSNVGYLLARRALERSENAPLAQVLRDWVLEPLGLTGPRLAESRADLAGVDLVMPGYHPGWVYHGLLVGPVGDAAALLAGILSGPLLAPAARALMAEPTPVGGPIPGRPWLEAGYGLGLMVGTMRGRGGPLRAVGHSAGGPGSGGAAYGFPDLPGAPVVAAFGPGDATDACEWRTVELALT